MHRDIKHLQSIRVDRFRYPSPNGFIEAVGVFPISKKKLPLILFYRGGTGDFGAIENRTIANFMLPLAEKGFVVFGSQYSGGPGSQGRDYYGGSDTLDMPALLALLKKQKRNINFNRIGILAVSRGAMMACQNLRDGLKAKRAVFVSGSFDSRRIKQERPDIYEMWKTKKIVDVDDPTALENRSPLAFVDKLPTIPFLILHSKKDWRVPARQAKEMAKKLPTATLRLFPGDDHALIQHTEQRNELIMEWFKKI